MSNVLIDKIRRIELLPSPPLLAMKVIELVREDAPIEEIADVISRDSALAAKLLKTANSSFYRRSHTVSTIKHATTILGLQAVRTLVLGFSLVQRLKTQKPRAFDYEKYWRRSIYSATAARALAIKLKMIQKEEHFLAALLADIGMLALDQICEDYPALCRRAKTHTELAEIEQDVLGLTHADASGLLARQWKLPAMLAIPMGSHHRPESATDAFGTRMAHIVATAGLCADIFLEARAAEFMLELRQTCTDKLALTHSDCDSVVNEVRLSVAEVAPLFEVPLPPTVDLIGIAVQAAQLAISRAPAAAKSLPSKAFPPNKAVA
ncbi:MAG TPA: HDOD domain-containing protein [Tepidisphaeraceae bacterium]|jgi:HD-like signal output (HDOD) protein|nr:HDOD domain-containing protein [Tepidisphaeraceae bacterium]